MVRTRLVAGLLLVLLAAGTATGGLPTVNYDGLTYVELSKVADSLQSQLEAPAEGQQARLRTGSHVVTLTRNWARVLVDGTPVSLDNPVRVRKGVWLVPESFVDQVVPKLTAVAAPPPAAARPRRPRDRPRPPWPWKSYGLAPIPRSPGSSSRPRRRSSTRSNRPGPRRLASGWSASRPSRRSSRSTTGWWTTHGWSGLMPTPCCAWSSRAEPPSCVPRRWPIRRGCVLDFSRPPDVSARERATCTSFRTLVLDAGHGGHDSGAVGPAGLMEKELVLDVTQRVARLLEDKLGVKVLLSRDGDHFVPLRDRTSYANRERADLFVSIHANAHRVVASEGRRDLLPLVGGDRQRLPPGGRAREQRGAAREALGPRAASRSDVVKTILWDLAQSEFQWESSRLAEIVQDSMTQSLKIPNRGVKQAGFYVLGGAAMPAILIEIGFVTNPQEERRLKETRYRDEIARAILAGIAEYKRSSNLRACAAADRSR